MSLPAGARVGPYEVLGPIGAGGMGEVYRARDPRLGRDVAIKVLPTNLSRDQDRLRRFEQEARTAGSLNHPNILSIFDIGSEAGAPYVVSELLEGQTLRAAMAEGPFPLRKAVEHGAQIARGLAAAHEQAIIHRDIKPDNVFVTNDGRVKILDFGLAKFLHPAPHEGEATPSLSAVFDPSDPNLLLGTAGYTSPEQVRGLPADTRSDIFSLGAVLYEMLSGRRAFPGGTPAAKLSAILMEDPPLLSESNQAVLSPLNRVVRRCLEKNPEQRFQSARDVAFALEALSLESPVPQPVPRASATGGRRARTAAIALLILLVGLVSAHLLSQRSKEVHSLAVLPFVTEGADPETQFTAQRISDGLIGRLSQVPRLKVRSRQSVSRYQGREPDAREVGSSLQVEMLLTGRVIKHQEDLSIDAELLDTDDSSHIWGKNYHRKHDDLVLVEEEIYAAVLAKLRLTLSREDKDRLESSQLYLRGRHYWNSRTTVGLRKSVECFNDAIARQPDNAAAYAGLADSYNLLVTYGAMPPRDAFGKAKAAAEKALELDESLAQAHAALAFIKHRFELDWPGAETEFRQAIEIGGYAPARQWYSSYLVTMGRVDEAIAEANRAQEIDPYSLIVSSHLAWIYYCAHRYDEAIQHSRESIAKDPGFFAARRYLGMALEQQRRYPEAIAELRKGLTLSGDSTLMKATLGHAYAASGRTGEAHQALEELKDLSQRAYVSPYLLGLVHAGLGERDAALRCLQAAYEERSDWTVYLNVDPRWDGLRSEPRFIDLVQRVGLGS